MAPGVSVADGFRQASINSHRSTINSVTKLCVLCGLKSTPTQLLVLTACARFFVLIGIEGFAARLCAESGGAALRFLPFLLAAERGQIEEIVRAADCLTAATVVGVSVKNLVSIADETAQSRQVEWLFSLEVIGCSGSLVLGLGPIICTPTERPIRR